MCAVSEMFGAVSFVFLWAQHFSAHAASAEKLYFDKYGDCEMRDMFDLSSEEYELHPVGGGFVHESLICDMTFKAPLDFGICLKFDELHITDCSTKIKIYSGPTASGTVWRVLRCTDSNPKQMCTTQRHVTIQIHKDRQNHNTGYDFKINVSKSNSVTEEGVLFASIGVFVGIILGVVVVIVVLALSVLYCCYKWKKGQKLKMATTAAASAQEGQTLVQPSAPPVEAEDPHWAPDHQSHLYPNLHSEPFPPQHPPPPYGPPPPYEHEQHSHEHHLSTNVDETYPVKQ